MIHNLLMMSLNWWIYGFLSVWMCHWCCCFVGNHSPISDCNLVVYFFMAWKMIRWKLIERLNDNHTATDRKKQSHKQWNRHVGWSIRSILIEYSCCFFSHLTNSLSLAIFKTHMRPFFCGTISYAAKPWAIY